MRQLVAIIATHVKFSERTIYAGNSNTLKAGNFDKFNDLAINHLFASMFKIHSYICPDNRLYLTHPPIGPVWMRNKIAQAEI